MQQKECKFIKGYSDKNSLKCLWKEAFGDEEKYIDFLYETGYISQEGVYALVCDGELVSALVCMDLLCNNSGIIFNAKYIYYAATFKKYRGMGRMSLLIKSFLKLSSGEIFTLIPSSVNLFNFYSNFGFVANLSVNRKTFTDNTKPEKDLKRVYFDDKNIHIIYAQYYKKYSAVPLSLFKGYDLFKNAISEANFYDDKGGFFEYNGNYGFILFRDGQIYLREAFGDNIETLARAISYHYSKKVILEDVCTDGDYSEKNMGMMYIKDEGLKSNIAHSIGYINQLLN